MATTPPRILSAAPKTMFGQRVEVLLRVLRDVEPVVETIDRAVVLRVGDRLRYRRRELVDLGHEWRDECRQDGDEADHEAEEDDGRSGLSAQARLESHDEGVESDREEGRGQRPHEEITHLRQQIADERQREQAEHDLHHGRAADVDGQPSRPGFDGRGSGRRRRRALLSELHGEVSHGRKPIARVRQHLQLAARPRGRSSRCSRGARSAIRTPPRAPASSNSRSE